MTLPVVTVQPMREERAVWTTAYINDLPDSAFACIDNGGKKDEQGKTVPRSLRHYPHHDREGKVDPEHLANARARVSQQGTTSCGRNHLFNDHKLAADQASDEGRSMSDESTVVQKPPRDNLVRSVMPGVELRHDGDDETPILAGHFAVFNQWAKIDSAFEGTFMERLSPGAFRKAFQEKRDAIRVLFQHGQDPQIGNKPLGPISELREDKVGAYYEVPLVDTSYNRDLVHLLKAGLLGASFRFRVEKDEFKRTAPKSPHNPEGLPERTITEVDVMEFGPVTFPAYAGASAGIRSETDDYIRRLLVPEFDEIRELLKSLGQQALSGVGAGAIHSNEESSVSAARPIRFRTREEYLTWLTSQTSRS